MASKREVLKYLKSFREDYELKDFESETDEAYERRRVKMIRRSDSRGS